ncbi:hypothetical protein GGS20DRAFT_561463 [Poronia punctata]|nr:hypothetical protein GGS20DRAFT_561463 [Poronia punctata]
MSNEITLFSGWLPLMVVSVLRLLVGKGNDIILVSSLCYHTCQVSTQHHAVKTVKATSNEMKYFRKYLHIIDKR